MNLQQNVQCSGDWKHFDEGDSGTVARRHSILETIENEPIH
jgi:hypothetical protein